MQDASILPVSETKSRPRMAQLSRLYRYGTRFLLDRQYRNHVLDLVNRQAQGAAHADLVPSEGLEWGPLLRGKRVFVAAGCEMTFLAEHLQHWGVETCHTFALGRGSDPMTEVLTPGSNALTEQWDAYLLSVSQLLRRVVRRLQLEGSGYSKEEQEKDLEGVLENYRHAIQGIRDKSDAPIFIFSYLLTYHPSYGCHEYRSMKDGWSLIELWHVYHLRLYQMAREIAGVYVLDADVALQGMGKETAIDPAHSTGVYDHPTREGAKRLATHFAQQLCVLEPRRQRIKCAVFDLDGTLWAGILREDGPDGVAVNEYHLGVMEILAARGILLAVCSKNDAVESAHLPSLLGPEVHGKIVSMQLGWVPKSQALKDIAEELNIGLDALAFFDDSAYERAEVSANAPGVLVLTPEDIFRSPNMLEFQHPGEITPEALTRTHKYQQQRRRKEAELSATTTGLDDFLRSCEFRLELRAPEAGEMSRVFELLQRTNQLNATLTRSSLEQLKRYVAEPSRYLLRIARLGDRFGDYGLVGFTAVEKGREAWEVLELAFSCRAAGRGVERATLNHVAGVALDAGAREVLIRFVDGPRNQQMLEILKECRFAPTGAVELTPELTRRLQRPLRQPMPSFPAWLDVQVSA